MYQKKGENNYIKDVRRTYAIKKKTAVSVVVGENITREYSMEGRHTYIHRDRQAYGLEDEVTIIDKTLTSHETNIRQTH